MSRVHALVEITRVASSEDRARAAAAPTAAECAYPGWPFRSDVRNGCDLHISPRDSCAQDAMDEWEKYYERRYGADTDADGAVEASPDADTAAATEGQTSECHERVLRCDGHAD